jgi:hypothetical protein
MTEIDGLLRDLEAGLYLQTRMQQPTEKRSTSEAALTDGSLKITFEGRQVEPDQGFIGRDFVAWVDARGLSIVPGRLASIRVDKTPTRSAEGMRRFTTNHKLSLLKYLRGLAATHVELVADHSSTSLVGSLLGVRGNFAVIDLGSAVNLVEVSAIKRIVVPVHNFSAQN